MTATGAPTMEMEWGTEARRLGRDLCAMRYRALWTQQQLAAALGIGQPWVSRLETGRLSERAARRGLERARCALAARLAARRAQRAARARLWQTEAEMLGLVLRRQRLLAKWNQRELAAALGVAQPTIARLERGRDIAEDAGRRWYAAALVLTAAARDA